MSDSERRSPDESGNLSGIESISNKLMEVTKLAEKLDAKLSEAGARNRGSPENLETDSVKPDDKFVGDSSSRLSSPRLVSSTAEMMKKEERNETLNEVGEYFCVGEFMQGVARRVNSDLPDNEFLTLKYFMDVYLPVCLFITLFGKGPRTKCIENGFLSKCLIIRFSCNL